MFQEKKIELKKNFIEELEDKKKNIESERNLMDFIGGRVYMLGKKLYIQVIYFMLEELNCI